VTMPQSGNSGVGFPTAVIVSVTTLLIAILGGVVFLIYQNKPIEGYLTVMASVVVPTLTVILTVHTSQKVGDVQAKVDGKIDNLITDKSNLEQQVAASGMVPVTAKVAFDPDSNTGPIPRISSDTMPQSVVGRHSSPPTG
jgi:hypothetical protein